MYTVVDIVGAVDNNDDIDDDYVVHSDAGASGSW